MKINNRKFSEFLKMTGKSYIWDKEFPTLSDKDLVCIHGQAASGANISLLSLIVDIDIPEDIVIYDNLYIEAYITSLTKATIDILRKKSAVSSEAFIKMYNETNDPTEVTK